MPRIERISKINKVNQNRFWSIILFLEWITNPHNLSAIIRTADATWIPEIHYTYWYSSKQDQIYINQAIARWANKWVALYKHSSSQQFLQSKKNNWYQIIVSTLDNQSKQMYDINFTSKSVLVMWSEANWVSQNTLALASQKVFIPMIWMVQSLNISVATWVLLYEIYRQNKYQK